MFAWLKRLRIRAYIDPEIDAKYLEFLANGEIDGQSNFQGWLESLDKITD